MQSAGTVMAAVFHVVGFRQRGNHRRAAGDLADAVQNDLRAPVIEFYGSANLDGATGETAHVSNIFQVVFENDDREWTNHLIFTEIKEVNALHADFHAYDFSGHTPGLADVLTGLLDRNAVDGAQQGSRPEKDY